MFKKKSDENLKFIVGIAGAIVAVGGLIILGLTKLKKRNKSEDQCQETCCCCEEGCCCDNEEMDVVEEVEKETTK